MVSAVDSPYGRSDESSSVCSTPVRSLLSPEDFFKGLGKALTPLHLKWIFIIPYLDDPLIIGPSAAGVTKYLRVTLSFLKNLGWLVN